MKKFLNVFICFTFILLITSGCSNNANQPDNDLIKNDLKTSLTEYKEFLDLNDYKIDKSKTEDKTFTATIYVTANGQYATHSLVAEVSYTRYDQGWQMDTCDWSNLEFSITNYPQSEEIIQWNDYIEKNVIIKDIDGHNSFLTVHRIINTNVSKYIHISDEEKKNYEYNPENRFWDEATTENIDTQVSVDKEIEGTYYSIDEGMVTKISDVNGNSFKFSIKGVEQNKWMYEDIFKAAGWESMHNEFYFEGLTNTNYRVPFASQLTVNSKIYNNVCIEYHTLSYPPFLSMRNYILIE
ncbi:hypothetical protein [Thomasclavelia spiroformis]|jgi:hypothetical protein|uniref:hypothetical protein n=1 Tax=Thomasclavelia spiroformis TaxID=29348 RepID=UPI00241DDE76|nr:hypothetical protein [Thomasclavelia spiroformis]